MFSPQIFRIPQIKDTPKEISDACMSFVSQKTINGLKVAITSRKLTGSGNFCGARILPFDFGQHFISWV